MVSLGKSARPRRSVRGRDFSPMNHRAPATTRRLSRAYHEPPSSRWRLWLWLSECVFILGLTVALMYSPMFTIDNIVINNVNFHPTEERLAEIMQEVMSTTRFYIFPQSNLFFFSKKNAGTVLAREFYIDDVTIVRHWPNVLKINVANNVVVATWRAENGSFLMDRRGVLVQYLSDESSDIAELAVIVEEPSEQRALGDQVTSDKVAVFIDTAYEQWKKDLPDTLPTYMILSAASLPTIQAYTADGWYVNLTTESAIAPQLESLKRLLEERVKDDVSKLQYIDVRFGNRLYFKLK